MVLQQAVLFLKEQQLPLVEDLSILRNILYSGVWTKYQAIQRKRAEEEAKG